MTAFLDATLSVLRLIHIVTAVMMAWPFYALVTVNNRTRLGPPLGDRVDVYMEHIIKCRTIPCYVFQATALVTSLAIILIRGLGLETLVTNATLGLKVAFLLLIAALLSYVHSRLQPAIDRLFAQAPTSPIFTGDRRADSGAPGAPEADRVGMPLLGADDHLAGSTGLRSISPLAECHLSHCDRAVHKTGLCESDAVWLALTSYSVNVQERPPAAPDAAFRAFADSANLGGRPPSTAG